MAYHSRIELPDLPPWRMRERRRLKVGVATDKLFAIVMFKPSTATREETAVRKRQGLVSDSELKSLNAGFVARISNFRNAVCSFDDWIYVISGDSSKFWCLHFAINGPNPTPKVLPCFWERWQFIGNLWHVLHMILMLMFVRNWIGNSRFFDWIGSVDSLVQFNGYQRSSNHVLLVARRNLENFLEIQWR